jgi:putative transposase
VSRFELIAAECAKHDVTRMAELVEVSTSGYYKHLHVQAGAMVSPRVQRRRDLEVKILAHHRASRGTYGSPRITADLHAEGERVSENTVAAIMADLGVAGISPWTFRTTTVVDPAASFPEDLVGRRFDRGRLDAVWSSDITYLSCGESEMYLCVRSAMSIPAAPWAGRWPITCAPSWSCTRSIGRYSLAAAGAAARSCIRTGRPVHRR